ncbi:sulfatase [Natrialbaceae archaeon A-CW3]
MTGVILITADTLRADHLGCYGSNEVQTPNLDQFAEDATRFESNYAASYPTVPNRLDTWSGRYNFLTRGWTSLNSEDIILPELLAEDGILSYLIYDTPFLGTYDFTRGFSGWQRIRGHHSDRLTTDSTIDTTLPAQPHKLKKVSKVHQYLRNRFHWHYEGDYIAPRTFGTAIEWLEQNRGHDEFCLVVDSWDPHEIFDAPTQYIEQYADTEYNGDEIIYPAYGRPDYMSEEELNHVKARYQAKISMVDRWVGELIDAVDRLGLSDDVMIIFTSDHGHLFGEHDLQGKPTGSLGKLYQESTWTPLLIRHPDEKADAQRVENITQPPDLMPTILDYFDLPIPKSVHGSSLLPHLFEEDYSIRDYAFTGRYPESPNTQAKVFDGWAGPADTISPITVTGSRWSLIIHPDKKKSELYNLNKDPDQEVNVLSDYPEIAEKLRRKYIGFAQDHKVCDRMIDPFSGGSYTDDAFDMEQDLYIFRDGTGKRFAHLSESLARARQPNSSNKIKHYTFESLLAEDSSALIYLNQQYYRVEDLIPAAVE